MTAQVEKSEPVPVSFRRMERSPTDLKAFGATFALAQTSDRQRTSESLEWQYFKNTSQSLFVDVAVGENQPQAAGFAGIYATLPGYFRIGGKRRLGTQSLDTLTAPAFRGRGLFLELARRTYSRAANEGAALVYGFPNGNSAHGFYTKLGWEQLDPVPFLIRPLRTKYATERLKLPASVSGMIPNLPLRNPFGGMFSGGNDVVELASADERVTRLWERFAQGVGIAIERDAPYVQWRLFNKPDESYRTLAIENGDELTALCSYCVKEKHGGKIGYVMELLCEPSIRGRHAASRLLALAVRAMADDGADAALAWCFAHSPNFPVYARHLFVPLPHKLRPIELHFGARAFDPSIASVVNRRSAWYISYLDSDTV